MNRAAVISIQHLYKSFGTNEVLKDFSLELEKGETLVVIGRSGIGKSVLIKCIVGLLKADRGNIFVLGKDMTVLKNKRLDEHRKKIGFCFQGSALYDSMSVRENLELPLERNLGMTDQNEMNNLVQGALEDVGLLESIDQVPASLSGGMRKRLSIARTLVLKPEIILYDEPTGGLDPITSTEINHLIVSMQKKYNISSIIITHDISCAKTTSNRMIYLKEGGQTVEGNFETFRNQKKDATLKAFFDYFKIDIE
jgi:phospholipid/cholesterol/gamma-HCH transport system ATP-binding protein